MKPYNLSHSILPVGLDGDVAAGVDGARVTSLAEIDTKDCESIIIIFNLGTVVATGLITVWAKTSDTSGSYGAGTVGDVGSIVNTAGEGDNLPLVLEVHRPTERYMRVDYQRTVANVTIQSVQVIKVLNREVRDSEVAARSVLNSPEQSTT